MSNDLTMLKYHSLHACNPHNLLCMVLHYFGTINFLFTVMASLCDLKMFFFLLTSPALRECLVLGHLLAYLDMTVQNSHQPIDWCLSPVLSPHPWRENHQVFKFVYFF